MKIALPILNKRGLMKAINIFNQNHVTSQTDKDENILLLKPQTHEFKIDVTESLRTKYDLILNPESLSSNNCTAAIQDLPKGYVILVNLYKDHYFMNTIRWSGDESINAYLKERHPDAIKYLSANKLRVTSAIVGRKPEDDFAIRESASVGAGAGASTCHEHSSQAVATVRTNSTNRFGREYSTSSTAAFERSAVVCCRNESRGRISKDFTIWSRKTTRINNI